MRVGSVLVVIWLLIGALAAGQRGYFEHSSTTCARTGTVIVTVAAGPLNYFGANPTVKCTLPHPSK
jgi:membrane protein YdbS with pleckstrin-like domain